MFSNFRNGSRHYDVRAITKYTMWGFNVKASSESRTLQICIRREGMRGLVPSIGLIQLAEGRTGAGGQYY